MFLPLVDSLRCPKVHEDSWLIASIDRAEERDIVAGALGCPVCHAEYPIHDGIVYFSDQIEPAEYPAPSEDEATLIAAALDLTEARMTAALHGAWGANAPIIRGLSPAQLILVNPPTGISSGDGISMVYSPIAPFAVASLNAAAFDATADQSMIDSLTRALRPGGRLLGPASVPVPPDFTTVAHNSDVWVAQSGAGSTSAPVQLRRSVPGA